jgi:hypothetical protein
METTIPCPFWCEHTLGHEYEDESRAGEPQRHHERNVLTLAAERFRDPYDVTVTVGSTEQITMSLDGVGARATPPAVWVNAENLKTFDALGFDLDPDEADRLADSLHKAAAMARGEAL